MRLLALRRLRRRLLRSEREAALEFVTPYFERKYFVTLLNWNCRLVHLFDFALKIAQRTKISF
jgi:hypothetical protein